MSGRRAGKVLSKSHTFNVFARVLPYVWPHRRKVYLSFLFAALVAVFWGLNLSAAFPVVTVLLEKQGLRGYVDEKITKAQTEVDERSARVKILDQRIEELHATGAAESSEAVDDLLNDRARQQGKLSDASHKLLMSRRIKKHVVSRLPRDAFDTLALILGLLLIATILKGICVFIQDMLVGVVVELTIMGIRKDCFRKTLALDYQTLSLSGTAELMSRFTFDINVMANGLRLLGGKVIREPLKAATCIVLAFYVNWRLTLLSMLFVPVAGIIFYRFGKKLKVASHRLMESMSRIYKTLEEAFDAFKVVIAFNGAVRHRRRFHRENKRYFAKAMQIVRIDALTSPTTETLGLLAAFIALLPGAYLVLRGETSIWGFKLAADRMDVSQLSVLYVLLAGVIDPARKLSSVYTKLKRSTAAADRIFDLMDTKSLVNDPAEPKVLPRHTGTIDFKDINFSYATKDEETTDRPLVLNGVNLTVQAGEVIVVVGENGSGKSTLVNLLPRFYDPERGTVLIDGMDIRETRLRDLRNQIGVVTQETLLFDESIFENIRYGKPSATSEEILTAAAQAHVTQFVEQFPEGFDTPVGEKGRRLSGGQRQRIALARAILRNPAILILDEATSAIDSQSEFLIHQTLRKFTRDRTTFIITHSVSQSIIDFVTRIVVMEEGKLIAVGTHEALIRDCSVYEKLFHAQVQQRSA